MSDKKKQDHSSDSANVAHLNGIFRRNILIIIFFTAITVIAGLLVVKYVLDPTYSSTGSLYVAIDSEYSPAEPGQYMTEKSKQIVQTASEMITNEAVLKKVKADLNYSYSISEMKSMITVESSLNSYIIVVNVSTSNSNQSKEMLNMIMDDLILVCNEKEIPYLEDSISVIDYADFGTSNSLSLPINVIIFLGLGLTISLAIVFFRELFSTSFKGKEEIAQFFGVPIIGTIYDFKHGSNKNRKNIERYNESSYSKLLRAIDYSNTPTRPKVIQFTSSVPGEGKTTTSVNLARQIARSNQRVLLVDLDLRKPQISSYFPIQTKKGVVDLLGGGADIENAITHIDKYLDVIISGTRIDDPLGIIRSNKLPAFLKIAAQNYDYVILDSTPIVVYTDALVICELVDGVVYVVDFEKTKRDEMAETLDELKKSDTKILGICLNRVKFDKKKNSYY